MINMFPNQVYQVQFSLSDDISVDPKDRLITVLYSTVHGSYRKLDINQYLLKDQIIFLGSFYFSL